VTAHQLDPQPAPAVTPQPLPTTVNVAGVHATGPAGSMPLVRLEVSTPAGSTVVFLPPDMARQVADLLAATALQVRSGLVGPAGPLPGNGGRPQG
jgi:hypothetical protein